MDTTEQINLFAEFIAEFYVDEVNKAINEDKESISIDFSKLVAYSVEVAEELLQSPEETLKALNMGVEQYISNKLQNTRKLKIRVFNLPKSAQIGLGEIRHENIDKFWEFNGSIIRVGDVGTMPSVSKEECPSCGNILNIYQLDKEELKSATRCGCGRKGKFRLISREWKNVQHIIVEEYIEDYTDKKARPTTIQIMLDDDLVNEKITKKLQPGKHIKLTGRVLAKQVRGTKIKNSAYHKFEIYCNSISVEDISLFNLKVPNKYITEFKKINPDFSFINEITDSMFWAVEGQQTVKEILAISRARGVKTYHEDGKLDQRDTINVLMIGNPGTAKSEVGKLVVKIDIINMIVSGKGVSGAGLTSTTTRDPDLGVWCVDQGAVPRVNKGSIFIDEIDKIEDKDTSALNEAMVNLSFMTAKANQQVTLQADTNIVAAANPEGRRFDPMIDKYKQITLKPDFLDRFDIWIAIEKDTQTSTQKKVIGKIISRFRSSSKRGGGKYNLQWLQYYYAWIIQNFKPEISEEVENYAQEEISKIMNRASSGERSSDISYRLVGNIIRFSIAIAKILQCKQVNKEHIDRAIHYQIEGFRSLDMVDEHGKVVEEKLQFEDPPEKKRKKNTLIELIRDAYDLKGEPLSIREIEKVWEDEGHDPKEVEDIVAKLNFDGHLFVSKVGKEQKWRPI